MKNKRKSKRIRPSENKIIQSVINLFRRKGITNFHKEVQFCERYIDLFLKKPNKNRYYAIEAKVDAPSKAFRQAQRYLFAADYVYVALLKNCKNTKAIEMSNKTGIGLIFAKRISRNRYYADIHFEPKESIYKNDAFAELIWKLKDKVK